MTNRLTLILLTSILLAALSTHVARAQRPPVGRRAAAGDGDEKETPPKPLPNDKRLLALHQEFIKKAERLAAEYENTKNYDKAVDVYGEILKLVPQYAPARAKYQALRQQELGANKMTVEVQAGRGWQPTGVRVTAGKPIAVRATGTWTFSFTRELGPDGMEIPEELREYNLGCLMGAIDTGNPKEIKPFVVGSQTTFIAEQSGQLYLGMYDAKPTASSGTLKVEISGSYDKR